ncbi:hypothetical protein BW98_02500, partial [Escherichia coli O157:H7 str. 08-3037]
MANHCQGLRTANRNSDGGVYPPSGECVTKCHGESLRGHIDVTTEDLASALDVTEDVIDSILHAMQGRVLDGDLISGWEKRQVMKEDNGNVSQTAKSPAERKRAQRERERLR